MQKPPAICLPEKVKTIINRLMEAGWEAYAVGGCIRDSVLGRTPDDWDITTSASPYQVKELFPRTLDTGIKHGTVTVMLDKEGFEVTTYRIDGEYEDGRHPREVTFTKSLAEDLRRRDFTINAMAYNETEGLVDIFGGMEDIRQRLIRCVGSPRERFTEDALRMMRAVRFSAQLSYDIEKETAEAIRELSPALRKISAERVQTELLKLLLSEHPEYLKIAYETGITAVVLPEFDACMETEQNNPHHCYTVGAHTLEALKAVRANKTLRLAVLLHDVGKPGTRTTDEAGIDHFYGHPAASEELAGRILRRLKLDNDTAAAVKKIVRFHDYEVGPGQKGVRRAMYQMGEEIFPSVLEVKEADILAQSSFGREEKQRRLAEIWESYRQVMKEKQCVSLKTLAVTGRDLMESLSMKPGKELGEMLKALLEWVLEEPSRNEKRLLLEEAKRRGQL